MNIPNINDLKPAQCRENVFKKKYPKFYHYLISMSSKLVEIFNFYA